MVKDDSRPNYVLFLTDGLPTAGETRETAIADDARQGQPRSTPRLFVFGVGFDVNARLLDRLSGGNGGTSEYVTPDEDIESHVGRFYAKMTSPVLAEPRDRDAGHRPEPDLSARPARPLRGRPDRLGRPLSPVGQDDGEDRGQGRRRAAVARVPGRARRRRPGLVSTTSSRGSGRSAGSASSSTRSTCTGRTRS